MAFCAGALATIRKIWNEITPELEKIIETVTTVTGQLLLLEADPTVAAIVAIIPGGSAVEGWINTALNVITGVDTTAETVIQKITAFLAGLPTKAAKDAGLFKLASMASKAADQAAETANATKTDSFYDSAVQLHIMVNKG